MVLSTCSLSFTSGQPQIKKRYLSTGQLGLKPAGRTFFVHLSKKIFFFPFFPLYFIVYKKNEIRKKKKKIPISRLAVSPPPPPTRHTGNDCLLKGVLKVRAPHQCVERLQCPRSVARPQLSDLHVGARTDARGRPLVPGVMQGGETRQASR